MSYFGYGNPPSSPLPLAGTFFGSLLGTFHPFAQRQPFCFHSSWFTLTNLIFILPCSVSFWDVLCPHKDEAEVGLLWFTFGGTAARNLYLSSTWHIKSMRRFAACSALLGFLCLHFFGRMDREAASSETADEYSLEQTEASLVGLVYCLWRN